MTADVLSSRSSKTTQVKSQGPASVFVVIRVLETCYAAVACILCLCEALSFHPRPIFLARRFITWPYFQIVGMDLILCTSCIL